MRKSEKKRQVTKRDRYLKIRVTEEELESSKKEEIDPRLQKLSEYRFEEDD